MPSPDTSSQRPRIWVVDDSPTEAAITVRTLGSDYEIERFGDGSFVVERLSAGAPQPDLLLLDWVMPGMAGDEVCRFLRSRDDTRALPIILVTASRVETSDVVAGLAAGANDYVARPFAPAELRARVEAAIRTKQFADEAKNERARLETVNALGHALLETSTRVDSVLDHFATTLSRTLCDGCAVTLLPGTFPAETVYRHRNPDCNKALEGIAALADPVVLNFGSKDEALRTLPPIYHPYIEQCGLRSLAILPFPIREPIEGVVTVTRDGASPPFDAADLATIETCIEYAGLAVLTALRFDSERAARQQLDSVLAQLPLGIIVNDIQGRVTLANEVAALMLPGLASATTLSAVYTLAEWSALDGGVLTEAEWQLGRALHSNFPTQSELLLRARSGGPTRAVMISSVPLRDVRGSIVGTVSALDDVTAQRAIEVDRQRVAEFQQQMLAIVGHDLRNPLSALLTGTELLQTQLPADAPQQKLVKRLENSTNRMARMVEQLLDVTRARLGSGIPIARRDIDLSALVSGVLEELALAYPKATFEVSVPPGITGTWDPDRISRVVSNLVSNAIQYGRADAPIGIALEATESEVVMTVSNQIRDAFIPADQLATLFEPYRRGADRAQQAGGLGLGLYIVRELVRAHGGTIEATSTPAGTAFVVRLPRAR